MKNQIFSAANILIPQNVNMEHWSVVACDQYTSEQDYWNRIEQKIGQDPSALHLILPEVYLENKDVKKRIENINQTMEQYSSKGLFQQFSDCYIYLERTLESGKIRHGLVGKVDLEAYDYTLNTVSPIRPTEGTVESRLPPRVQVRQNALLEMPHIMVLIDDPECSVIEPLATKKNDMNCLYSFDLMEKGGSVSGFQVPQEECRLIEQCLETLWNNASKNTEHPLLIAIGDGNHSLATAKACFEKIKSESHDDSWKTHPSRWALVELVNLHDTSLEFEPIHRVLFDVDVEQVKESLFSCGIRLKTEEDTAFVQQFSLVYKGQNQTFIVERPSHQLTTGSIQKWIDMYLKTCGGYVDYIHGEEVVEKICKSGNTVGFLLPSMKKSDLFLSVQSEGALPRKTFSMGHAWEKRYYLECRKIR